LKKKSLIVSSATEHLSTLEKGLLKKFQSNFFPQLLETTEIAVLKSSITV